MTSPNKTADQTKEWEKNLWSLVEEQGTGASINFVMAIRSLFSIELLLQAQRLREALEQYNYPDECFCDSNCNGGCTCGDGAKDAKQTMLYLFDKTNNPPTQRCEDKT